MDGPHAGRQRVSLRGLAESARLSNLPTVWAPVLTAAALTDQPIATVRGLAAVVTLSALYIAGMLLNDLADVRHDRARKPDRPIPAGRLRMKTAAVATAVCFSIAIVIPSLISRPAMSLAAQLAAVIVAYDALHKAGAWTAVFIAACRALTYPLAAAMLVVGDAAQPIWPAALAAAAYTGLLTLAARREDIPGVRIPAVVTIAVPLPFLLTALAYQPEAWPPAITAAAVFLAVCAVATFHAACGRIPAAVHGWLAALCLADALLVTLLGRPELALVAAACWLITTIMQRRIAGT